MPSDPRTPLGVGLEWAARITSLGLSAALPPLAGVFVDRRFGTGPAATLLGSAAGFGAMMVALLKIIRDEPGR